jgi:hypothetical protein
MPEKVVDQAKGIHGHEIKTLEKGQLDKIEEKVVQGDEDDGRPGIGFGKA